MTISSFKLNRRKTSFYIWISQHNTHLINMYLSVSAIIHDRYDTSFDIKSYKNYIIFCKFIYNRSSTLL